MSKTCVMVSNYLNHHQIPFCNAMYRLLKGSFVFIQTEPVEEERVRMGWKETPEEPYLKLFYEEPEACGELIREAEVVIFGGTENESYIEKRLESGKPVIRNSERLYRTGQWKAISPRGLRKKYHDHTRYRKAQVYLLCSGAYVPSDFHIVRAYPDKMFCWGYFPETRHYDIMTLLGEKGFEAGDSERIPYLLWTARMIECKRPELAVETAEYLRSKGLRFHMDLVGGGELLERTASMIKEKNLEACVSLPGFMKPEQVRERMEKADIFLFTSDRIEGWGAVVNESMNSGCAVVAGHMAGSVPYLIRHGENGFIFREGHKEDLFTLTERLVRDEELCRRMGKNAYRTITECWNAENAAERLVRRCVALRLMSQEMTVLSAETADEGHLPADTVLIADGTDGPASSTAVPGSRVGLGLRPCDPAPVISERAMYRRLTRIRD